MITKNYIEIVFENCKAIRIPERCIDIVELSKENVELIIKNDYDIEWIGFAGNNSPFERLRQSRDIVAIKLISKLTSKDEKEKYNEIEDECKPTWFYEDEDNFWGNPNRNEYQKVEVVDFRTLKITINKENKKYTLNEILDKVGKKFKDETGQVYEVLEEGINTYINKKILNSEFVLVE